MSKSIYFFPADAKATLGEVGGKGLSLLESSRASLPVPPGCILTVYFFEPWLSQLKTTDAWKMFLDMGNDALAHACAVLKQTAAAFPFTEAQEAILTEALRKFDTDVLFAIRSSSPHEDLEGASFAGGYETVLGVTQDTLHHAIRRCFVSSLDYRVVVYMRAMTRLIRKSRSSYRSRSRVIFLVSAFRLIPSPTITTMLFSMPTGASVRPWSPAS